MSRLKELNKLENYLRDNKIPYDRIDEEGMYKYNPRINRHQIMVPSKEFPWKWDVICHYGSYGYEQGLLEGMGNIFGGGEPEGYLTAEDVIERIKSYDQD